MIAFVERQNRSIRELLRRVDTLLEQTEDLLALDVASHKHENRCSDVASDVAHRSAEAHYTNLTSIS